MIRLLAPAVLVGLLSSAWVQATNKATCSPSDDVCEIYLSVAEHLTMKLENTRVYAHEGKLYKFFEAANENATKVPLDEVISVDGVERLVYAINGTIPAPPIITYEGQILRIHVKNNLVSDSVTLHWHGQHLRDAHLKHSPFMDGVPYWTQCPIVFGQTFTYEFKASPRGTFWYHSHIAGNRVDGLFGALIIKERKQVEEIDLIMHVGDWYHEPSNQLFFKVEKEDYVTRPEFKWHVQANGVIFTPLPFVSALIEGRGRYIDPKTGKSNGAPLKVYEVETNRVYRFRVINHGALYPFRISVDNHEMSVVASDGADVVPTPVESVIIHAAERYDLVITSNQSVGNYWIRAESIAANQPTHHTLAILRYNGAAEVEPTTSRRQCTPLAPCVVLNCPFDSHPSQAHMRCKPLTELDNVNDDVPKYEVDSQEHFFNFGLDPFYPTGMVSYVNGKQFKLPNSLEGRESISCSAQDCGTNNVCTCSHEIDLPYNKTIQMVLVNHGTGGIVSHPIHLHGHTFHVIKLGYAISNTTTLLHAAPNPNISCPDSRCNNPGWSDSGWNGGRVPGLKLKNAPMKDSLVVPAGGYAVIRFRSDNPGKWLLHCHLAIHSISGMSVALNEAKEKQTNAQVGFPMCPNFYNDATRDTPYIDKKLFDEDCNAKDDLNKILVGVCIALGALLLIQTLVLVTCWMKRWRDEGKEKVYYVGDTVVKNPNGERA